MMTPDATPHIKVTLDTIYATGIETRDGVLSIKSELEELNKDSADHEKRIRDLEKRIWIAAGIAMVGGAGISEVAGRILGG